MSEKPSQRRKLGEIFIEREVLCQKTVDRVVAIAKKMNKKFGIVLEEMGLITGEELAEALALQYKCRTVSNFAQASFAPEVLRVVTADTALQHLIFPLKLDGNKLHLAVSDPTGSKIVDNIAANNGLTILTYVGTRREINAAICRHYFGVNISEPTRRTVLVVEDDKTVLAMLQKILSAHYNVCTAVDGMDAYKEAVSKKPHVIVTDQEMPKLDGYGLLNALRSVQETKGIPVILISGSSSSEAEPKAFEKGFFDYIPKPVKETTILTRVKRAFDFYEQNNFLFIK